MSSLPQRSFTTTLDDIEADFVAIAGVDGKVSVDHVCTLFIKHYQPKVTTTDHPVALHHSPPRPTTQVSRVVTATLRIVLSFHGTLYLR